MSDYLKSLELDSKLRESLEGVVSVAEDLMDRYKRYSNDEYLLGVIGQGEMLIGLIDGPGISAYGWDEYYKGIIMDASLCEKNKFGRCRLMDFASLQRSVEDLFDGYLEDINVMHSSTNNVFESEGRADGYSKDVEFSFNVDLGKTNIDYTFRKN